MFIFTTKLYYTLGKQLLEQINSDSMINTVIAQEYDEYSLIFSTALFPQHKMVEYPEGEIKELIDIIPVWWSMRTFKYEVECINDFDFNLLKEHICHN